MALSSPFLPQCPDTLCQQMVTRTSSPPRRSSPPPQLKDKNKRLTPWSTSHASLIPTPSEPSITCSCSALPSSSCRSGANCEGTPSSPTCMNHPYYHRLQQPFPRPLSIESRGNELSLCLGFCQLSSHWQTRSQRTVLRMQQSQNGAGDGSSKKKIANLCVQRKQVVSLPTHVGISGDSKPLSEFLCQRAGMESVLNTNALECHEYVGSDTFRCTLPKLEILNFEVAPVVDLSVRANEQECIVEMLSCKFQGSEVVESQNERFSASMRNHLTWDKVSESDQTLEVNVQLNVSLEVYTLPFTLLPLSAVETPGNAILQAMVDRMVPIFLDHVLDDYYRWSQMDDAIKVPTNEPFCEKTISP